MGTGVTARSAGNATEREVLGFVRHRRREHDRRRKSDRFINAYLWMFVAFYLVAGVSGFIDADLTPDKGDLLDTFAWLPVVLLAVVWGVLHFATWQGPVLFSPPELQWVVAAPLSRRDLVLIRLRRALLIAGIAGIVGGVVVAGAAAATIGEGMPGVFVAASVGFAALALMATALSWNVERSVRWSAAVDRGAALVLVLAALMAVGAATGHNTVLWWSGPWGWAIGPVVAQAGWTVAGWQIQAGLLGIAAVGAIVLAAATADRFSEEELWRRAEAHSAASAALFFGDVRTVRTVARRDRARGRLRGRSFRLAAPPYPWLAMASRDVLALRRSPGRLLTAAILVAAAFVAAVAAIEQPLLGIAAFLGLYAAGSRLLEPIRVDVDKPDAHRILPWSWGVVMAVHCIVPTVILTVLSWAGLVVVGIGGFVPAPAIWPLGLVAPFAAAAIVTPAAISAARRPFPVESLIGGAESGFLLLVLSMISGPVLAAIVVDIAFNTMRDSFDRGITGATFGAIAFLAIATFAFVSWLWTREPPD